VRNDLKSYIDGRRTHPSASRTLDVINPAMEAAAGR